MANRLIDLTGDRPQTVANYVERLRSQTQDQPRLFDVLRREKLAQEMSHKPFVDPYEGVPEAFAAGVYRAPGQMAGLFDLAKYASPLYHAIQAISPTQTTLQGVVDDAVGSQDVQQAYEQLGPYGATENLRGLAGMAGEVVGEEGLTLGGLAAVKGLTKTPQAMTRLLDEIMHESVIRDQIGAIGSIGAKTANLRALETAKAMKANGVDADEIFTKTGWWLDHPDGKPRFEIDDSAAVMGKWPEMSGGDRIPMGAISENLQHPELYGAYPDVKDIRLAGIHGRASGKYYSSYPLPGGKSKEVVESTGDSTLLHELQHAIQQREGMARGGSPDEWRLSPRMQESYSGRLADMYSAQTVQQTMKLHNLDANDAARYLADKYGKEPSAGAVNAAKLWTADEISQEIDIFKSKLKDPSGRENYRRLAGEAEARLVQDRMNLTAAERAANPFYKGFDVPLADQIVRMDGGVSEAVGDWYHGTPQVFDDFEAGDIGAVWLTDSQNYADWLGAKASGKKRAAEGVDYQIKRVAPNVQNPKTIDILEEGRRVADEIGEPAPQTALEAQELLAGGMGWDNAVKQMINDAKSEGHDALRLTHFHDNWSIADDNTTSAMLVFDASKIKQAQSLPADEASRMALPVDRFANEIKTQYGLDNFDVYEGRDGIRLNMISVPKGGRKQGAGSAAMNELTKYADANGKRITLSVGQKDDGFGTTSRSRLVKFYKKLGFVENKGRNKDFTISDGMYRDPAKRNSANILAGGAAGAVGAGMMMESELDRVRRQNDELSRFVDEF